jgi:hypothetical protein
LLHWVQMLQNGAPRIQVVDGIWTSAEHRGVEVDQFYATFFHSSPDAASRAAWINQLLAGVSEADVERQLLTSSDYTAAHPDFVSFITGLYTDVLGRSPSSSDLAGWVQTMQAGTTRDALAFSFVNSSEAELDSIDFCFTHYLHATGDPAVEAGLLANIRNGLATPAATTEALLASDQYFALAQQSANG